ncbi:MAG TPA: N-acetyltransferase [Candidatus Acidoferrum sp.]|nr:N-acetyltransferase [Candidatus Acidoferrum sp.]
MKVSLRTYRPEDFETLCEIDQACYERDTAYSHFEMHAYLTMPGAECVVAEVRAARQRAIAGFCISARNGSEGYIITMDVVEKYRRSGIGSALLREIERRLTRNGVREVGLETATDNPAAVAFWQKHGYRTFGLRKRYYPRGRDAFSMAKIIGSSRASKA